MAASRSATTAEIRTVLLVAAPLVTANLAQMAMQVTNAVMVGHLGAVSLAAAGSVAAQRRICSRASCAAWAACSQIAFRSSGVNRCAERCRAWWSDS